MGLHICRPNFSLRKFSLLTGGVSCLCQLSSSSYCSKEIVILGIIENNSWILFLISLEGNDYIISADGKDDDRVWKYQEEELDIADLQDALENLNAEYADSFTDEMPSGKEEISLTVYLDNETYPTMEITLYRYDGSDCLAAVDGQPFAKISRSDVVELVEAVNAIVLTQPAA